MSQALTAIVHAVTASSLLSGEHPRARVEPCPAHASDSVDRHGFSSAWVVATSSLDRLTPLARAIRVAIVEAILPAVRVMPHRRGFSLVPGMMPPRDLRVCVFLDWQNLYHRAREAFVEPGAPAAAGQVDPLALGRLCGGRIAGGVLTDVRVYRGRPSRRHDLRSYSAFRRQTERWIRAGE